MLTNILNAYGLDNTAYEVHKLDAGLINYTWKITNGDNEFILQRINSAVFKNPGDIAENLDVLNTYVKSTEPNYLFVAPIVAVNGSPIVKNEDGDSFRLFPFVKNSRTINYVDSADKAYEAAKQFGTFTRLFKDYDLSLLNYTLADFHNLSLRIAQFKLSCEQAAPEQLAEAKDVITKINDY